LSSKTKKGRENNRIIIQTSSNEKQTINLETKQHRKNYYQAYGTTKNQQIISPARLLKHRKIKIQKQNI